MQLIAYIYIHTYNSSSKTMSNIQFFKFNVRLYYDIPCGLLVWIMMVFGNPKNENNVTGFCWFVNICWTSKNKNRAIANYLSSDLPYQLSPEDIFLTVGGTQAIDIILPVLARPGANILLPRPGYPQYDSRAACCLLEVRYFDLLPQRGWEVDLDSVEALTDENTVAMVLINPSNPCGNVFTHQHLKKVYMSSNRIRVNPHFSPWNS